MNSSMDGIIALYATIVTIILFFQGIEINNWMSEMIGLKNERERRRADLDTTPREAQDFVDKATIVRSRYPSVMAWIYTAIQAVLILTAMLALVPEAHAKQLWQAELPFAVLFLVVVVLWPVYWKQQKKALSMMIDDLCRRHKLGDYK